MIISKTPLRINFSGGATDLKDYRQVHGGAVLNVSINQYAYIIAKERVDNDLWLKYSKNEIVKNVDQVQNEVWKECLMATGVTKGAEIVAMADIPKGFGLGGSSAFTVGSLNALHALTGKHKSGKELAEEAVEIGKKISKAYGSQDYYASSHGGLNLIEFGKEEGVFVNPIIIPPSLKKSLSQNLLLFDMRTQKAIDPLSNLNTGMQTNEGTLHKIKEIVYATRDSLHSLDLRRFGELLHENWEYKKTVLKNISNSEIDRYYNLAREAGAIGGKMCCSPESGGFLLVYGEPEKQDQIRAALNLKEVPFEFESGQSGSKIIYVGE